MVIIDYSLKPSTVRKDRSDLDLRNLDEVGLRKIGKGRLFAFDDKQRVFFVVESPVLDYANQLAGVVFEFDRGSRETFAVSPDFFSNNLRFRLDQQLRDIEVYEVNGGCFRLSFRYKQFRDAVRDLYKSVLEDFCVYYPELRDNEAFQELFSR